MEQTRVGRGSWKGVAESIRTEIREGRYREGSKLPSEADLMREFGAAKMTVHRALRELAAEKFVRRVERVGTFVLPRQLPATRKIGLVLPTNEGFLEFNMLAGVRDGLDTGDQYVLYPTDNQPIAEADALSRVANEVDGVLILPSGDPGTSRKLKQLHDEGFPVVCVDRVCKGVDLPAVTTDNYQSSRRALECLLSERPHRVGYFGHWDETVSSLVDRYRAYHDTCGHQTHDPTEFARFIPPHIGPHSKGSLRLVEDALIRLLGREDRMTLAFCANEYHLEAIVQVCHSLPREMTEGLEIVAFNDWPRLRYQGFRVHTIRQDARGVGRQAADLLHRIWAGQVIEPSLHEVSATFIHALEPFDFGGAPVPAVGGPL